MRGKSLILAAMVGLAACSPSHAGSAHRAAGGAAPQHHPVSHLAVVPLHIGLHKFAVEVAASPAEQQQGLMFRTQMGADEGMIFPMKPPRPASFWMRNTVIPLDIIFIGADSRVLNIAANAVPYDETPLSSAGKVSAVLELNGGRAAQLRIKPGDAVRW